MKLQQTEEMNTLPRWFGRGRKKKASCDSSEPKPPEIVWLKEAEGAAHQTGTSSGSDTKLDLSSPDDDEDFHGLMSTTGSEMPPGLDEVAANSIFFCFLFVETH